MEKNSHEWYEQVYHAPKNMPDFKDYIQSAIDRGYKGRFDDVLAKFDEYFIEKRPMPSKYCLEIGCHLGKTAYWLLQRYEFLFVDGIDFSAPSIDYCGRNIGNMNASFIRFNVDFIQMTDKFYDLITCIDVAEHLDDKTYKGMLKEISRLLKPSGHCIFYGSMSTHNTHINIRNPARIIMDCKGLLEFVKMLPHNHILFRGV